MGASYPDGNGHLRLHGASSHVGLTLFKALIISISCITDSSFTKICDILGLNGCGGSNHDCRGHRVPLLPLVEVTPQGFF